MGRFTASAPSLFLLLLLLLLVGRGRGEGPTWGAEEDEEEEEVVAAGLPTTAEDLPVEVSGCPACDPSSCVSPFGCVAGVVRDKCGCCQVNIS